MVGNCSRPFQRRVVWAISATGVSVAVAQVWVVAARASALP